VDWWLLYRSGLGDESRVVVPLNDNLRSRVIREFHDAPSTGHPDREKTFLPLSRECHWPHMSK